MSEEGTLIDEVLAEGARLAEEADIYVVSGESLSLTLQGDHCTRAEGVRTWGMGIRIVESGRIGASSTCDPERWRECLHAALESSRATTPQEWGGLPPPQRIARRAETADPDFDLSPRRAESLLHELQEGTSQHRARIVEASVELGKCTITLANTRGLVCTYPRTLASVSCETISGDSTGFEFDQSICLDIDARRVGERAAFLAEHSLHAKPLPTGNYDLILSPIAATHLLCSVLVGALSGKNVKTGRSCLAPLLGRECASPLLQLYDDPFARGIGATDWDAEGMPARRIDFIRDGVLQGFAYDLRTAYRYGEESTASAVRSGHSGAPAIGVHNLVFDGERSDVHDGEALYVHDVVGAHTANPLTGDLSVELTNVFRVKDGEILSPVASCMLAGNVFEMLRAIEGLGRESRVVGHAILPEIRLSDQRVIGT